MTGLTINCPFGEKGKLTMRDDHTIVDYAIGWGKTVPQLPYIVDIVPGDWGEIVELETDWKKQMKFS